MDSEDVRWVSYLGVLSPSSAEVCSWAGPRMPQATVQITCTAIEDGPFRLRLSFLPSNPAHVLCYMFVFYN